MEIYIVIILIILFVSFVVIHTHMSNSKHEKKVESIMSKIENFEVTNGCISMKNETSMAYDDKRHKICFVDKNYLPKTYEYKDIIQSELVMDGETIFKQSISGTLGRSIIGGVMTGGIGAIVGGVTAEKKGNTKVKRIDLKLIINDKATPIYKVNFLNYEVNKGDIGYKKNYTSAEKWHGIITSIIKENNSIQKDEVTSNADELIKLKHLLDSDLISKEEFDIEKHKILRT